MGESARNSNLRVRIASNVEEIAGRRVRVVNATPIQFEGARIRVSISRGAAFRTDDTASLDALISRADRALDQA